MKEDRFQSDLGRCQTLKCSETRIRGLEGFSTQTLRPSEHLLRACPALLAPLSRLERMQRRAPRTATRLREVIRIRTQCRHLQRHQRIKFSVRRVETSSLASLFARSVSSSTKHASPAKTATHLLRKSSSQSTALMAARIPCVRPTTLDGWDYSVPTVGWPSEAATSQHAKRNIT